MYGNINNNLSGYGSFLGKNPNPMDLTSLNSRDNELSKMYAELEMMKNQTNQNNKTVFTEIAQEMSESSEDERTFIENSKEYISLNQQYQNEFSAFLIEKFSSEYANSKYGQTPEKILGVIRNKREEYKNKFTENLKEIKESNKDLITKNDELMKVNENLQKQLADIQTKLGAFIS
jgi:uncharacterized coiled-coil DUF342 family protein